MSGRRLARACRRGAWDALEVRTDSGWTPFALRLQGNPLEPSWDRDVLHPAIAEAGPGSLRLIAWSGTFADEPFAGDMRNWMRTGWDALQARLDAWRAPLADAGVRLALHPHATHLLSDVAGAMRVLVQRAQEPLDVVLAPADLLTAAMLGDGTREAGRARLPESQDVREHLTRAFATLGPRTPLCILGDVRPCHVSERAGPSGHGGTAPSRAAREPADEPGTGLETCPIGQGLLPTSTLRELLEAHVPPDVPVLAHGDSALVGAPA